MSNIKFPKWLNSVAQSKLDAYFLIGFATGFGDYPQELLGQIGYSVIVECCFDKDQNKQVTQRQQLIDCFAKDSDSSLSTAYVDHFGDSLVVTNSKLYFTAKISPTLLPKLLGEVWIIRISLCDPPVPNRNLDRSKSFPTNVSKLSSIPKTTEKHLVAVIDHGCPFAHQAYWSKDAIEQGFEITSRFLAIWDQDEYPDFAADAGTKPNGFSYGRQVLRNQINRFLTQASDGFGSLSEDLCYEMAQYPPMQNSVTHGSLVLGLLASPQYSPSLLPTALNSKPLDDTASKSDIVFVQLPRKLPLAPDRGAMELYCLDGLCYILSCAGDNTSKISVVIDYGSDVGPHDGSTVFEHAVDHMIAQAEARGIELQVVFPSGNSFDKSLHARGSFSATTTSSPLFWSVPIANEIPYPIEFWLDNVTTACELRITAPHTEPVVVDIVGQSVNQFPSTNPFYSVAVKTFDGMQRQVAVQISPTSVSDFPLRAVARAGMYKFELIINSKPTESNLNVNIYTAWGGSNFGFPQRAFIGKLFAQRGGDFEVTGVGTLLSTACGERTYAVGGYVKKDGSRAKYSGAGPVRGGKKSMNAKGAEYMSVSDEGYASRGILCMGTRSATWVRIDGTSIAAPQAARILSEFGVKGLTTHRRYPIPIGDGIAEFEETRLVYPK